MGRMLIRLLPLAVIAAIAVSAVAAHAAPPVDPVPQRVVDSFHAIPLTSHSGDHVPPSAGATTLSFILPPRREGEDLVFTGAARAPSFTLTSPTGATIVPRPSPDGTHVNITLLRPAGGTWVITLDPGSPAVVALAGAAVTYPSADQRLRRAQRARRRPAH
jgi:hypothetical protein